VNRVVDAVDDLAIDFKLSLLLQSDTRLDSTFSGQYTCVSEVKIWLLFCCLSRQEVVPAGPRISEQARG